MKKYLLFIFIPVLFTACNSGNKAPDVSGIKVDVQIERFDRAVFALDTTALEKSLNDLYIKYPSMYPIFMENVLGLDESSKYIGIKSFIKLNHFLFDSVNKVFANMNAIHDQFEKAFKYVKYYFPDYKLPKIVTIIGPPDLLAKTSTGEPTPDFMGPDFLGISLQFYLGREFSMYHDAYFIANVAPEFRSRRFENDFLVADAIKRVADDIYPDSNNNKGLIELMIEKGKQWWLLNKFLPFENDTIITGYTKDQLKWCDANEGLIWNQIITTEKDLFTKDPFTIQNYIGEAPFTQSMAPAPGNIGQWIGWEIVRKFVDKNPGFNINEVLSTSPRKILDLAKYKPK